MRLFVFTLALALAVPSYAVDPFEPQDRYESGAYKGELIRSDTQRPVKILGPQQLLEHGIDLKPGEVAFANFSDQNTFKILVINPDDIEKAIFQVDQFSPAPTGSHTQWSFQLKPGRTARAITQDPSLPRTERELTNVIYSYEGVNQDPSKPFNLFSKDHVAAGRFVSLESKAQTMVNERGHQVPQVPTKFTGEEAAAMFRLGLADSDHFQYRRPYNVFTGNCTTEALRLARRGGVGRGAGFRAGSGLDGVFSLFTKWSPLALVCSGVVDLKEWRQMPTLNQECGRLLSGYLSI